MNTQEYFDREMEMNEYTGNLHDDLMNAKNETDLWVERTCDCVFPMVCGCGDENDN